MGNIHPLADVKTKDIGGSTKIWQFCIVLEGAIIGNHCNLNCHTFVENNVIIGDNVTIKSGVFLWDGIHIEDNVFIGPNATFVNNSYPRSKEYPDEHSGVIIKKGASIGANATIMGGIVIGRYALVGAGSVLTKSISDFSLWYGNPAKHLGYVTKGGVVINLEFKDKQNRLYKLVNNEPILRND